MTYLLISDWIFHQVFVEPKASAAAFDWQHGV